MPDEMFESHPYNGKGELKIVRDGKQYTLNLRCCHERYYPSGIIISAEKFRNGSNEKPWPFSDSTTKIKFKFESVYKQGYPNGDSYHKRYVDEICTGYLEERYVGDNPNERHLRALASPVMETYISIHGFRNLNPNSNYYIYVYGKNKNMEKGCLFDTDIFNSELIQNSRINIFANYVLDEFFEAIPGLEEFLQKYDKRYVRMIDAMGFDELPDKNNLDDYISQCGQEMPEYNDLVGEPTKSYSRRKEKTE